MATHYTTVRLRHKEQDFDLPEGEHVIGRAPECTVCVDDPAVSRSHALLTVRGSGVTVEDLGSRNGVTLNGAKVDGSATLKEGDEIGIGDTVFTVRAILGYAMPARPVQRRASRGELDDALHVATTLSHQAATAERRMQAFRLLGGAAREKLVVGKAAEAEEILERPLAEVRSTLRGGIALPEEIVEYAAHLALQLARSLGKAEWVDYVIDLYTSLDALPPLRIVDAMEEVLDEVREIDVGGLHAYVNRLAAQSPEDAALRERIQQLYRRFGSEG